MKAAYTLALALSVAATFVHAEMTIACTSPIQSFGDGAKMAKVDYSAAVRFRDVTLSPNSVGYGPAAHRQYELTIAEGILYMARPAAGDTITVLTTHKPNQGAAMLQVATPEKWGEFKKLSGIGSLDDLNFELDDIVEESDCDAHILMPFKIIGHAKKVIWSMDTDNHRIVTTPNQDVEIVGIYNKDKKSKYFMVKGTNTHAHVVLKNLHYAGHLRNVVLEDGATLYLPQK